MTFGFLRLQFKTNLEKDVLPLSVQLQPRPPVTYRVKKKEVKQEKMAKKKVRQKTKNFFLNVSKKLLLTKCEK